MLMEGKRALITGGANGLGAATAQLFAAHGAAVAICDLPSMSDRGEALVESIRGDGGTAVFQPLDVRDPDATFAAVDAIAVALNGIDSVVASAGLGAAPGYDGPASTMLHMSPESFDAVQQVNVRGVLLTFQRAAQLMIAGGHGGSMVALGSMASKRPTAGAYSVSKAAVWMLTRSLAQELGPHGIRVNAIGPGYVQTELFESIVTAAAPGDVEGQDAFRDQRRKQVSLGRFGTPQDIANTALFLCSSMGEYFTGAILHPDGGYTSLFGGG